jgi:hypothetical protein
VTLSASLLPKCDGRNAPQRGMTKRKGRKLMIRGY